MRKSKKIFLKGNEKRKENSSSFMLDTLFHYEKIFVFNNFF